MKMLDSWTPQPCGDLSCLNGSFCSDSPPDFRNHQLYDGSYLAFHSEETVSSTSVHCECPARFTGLDCSIPYETCGSQHKCYFGGECFTGLESVLGDNDLFCDCSNAKDLQGGQYVGKYCEHLLTDTIDDESVTQGFQSQEQLSNGEGGCQLDCQNGGTCKLGRPNPDKDPMAYQIYLTSDVNREFAWCDCPLGFFGELCELPSIPCGDKACFNNAHCLEMRNDEGDIRHECDCQNTDDTMFAGKYCQYEATSTCDFPGNFEGETFFCTNGGHCRDEAHLGCYCPPGYDGFSCEFFVGANKESSGSESSESNAVCDLDCNGRGACVVGNKDLSYLESTSEASHLNISSTSNFQHCICDSGFTGLQCEHNVEQCSSDDTHFCLHGGKCFVSDDGKAQCDCSFAKNELSTAFAGDHCEHPATSLCSDEFPTSFCVNEGTCLETNSGMECDCLDGWTGRHCETAGVDVSQERPGSFSGGLKSLARIVFFGGAVLLLLALINSRWNIRQLYSKLFSRRYYYKSESPKVLFRSLNTQKEMTNLSPRADEECSMTFDVSTVASPEPQVPAMPLPRTDLHFQDQEPRLLFMGPPVDEDGNELSDVTIT